MTAPLLRLAAVTLSVALTTTSCAFGGVNTLPLPGAVATGSGNTHYQAIVANVGTLEPNSPVMLDDVVVGSIGDISVRDWAAVVDVRVKSDVIVPANAQAKVGQTSLLGSMHLALDPAPGQPPRGRLQPGTTIGIDRSATYPSTEQTLSSLSVVVNAGGLGQFGDFVRSTATALGGREAQLRELIPRLDRLMGTVDGQRDRFIGAVESLDRLMQTLEAQRGEITDALRAVPPALDVLLTERAQIVAALHELGRFGTTATDLVQSTQDDLVANLTNLAPTVESLADVGPGLGTTIATIPTFPFTQNLLDRGLRGDYFNIFASIDLTVPRLKRSLFLGTRWGDPDAKLTPAPGDPLHLNYTYEPLSVGVAPPVVEGVPTPAAPAVAPLPVAAPEATPPTGPASPIFAGPYPAAGGG